MEIVLFRRGIVLFNQGSFFAAHEVLEDIWRTAPVSEKKFWQGLTQIAVGFHHHSAGNRTGARSVLARAARNLADYPPRFCGIKLSPLLKSLTQWQQALSDAADKLPMPPLPQLDFSEDSLPLEAGN